MITIGRLGISGRFRPTGRGGWPTVRRMGRHCAPPAEPPAAPAPAPLPDDWRGYATADTDLEGWLAVLRPDDDRPMMDI